MTFLTGTAVEAGHASRGGARDVERAEQGAAGQATIDALADVSIGELADQCLRGPRRWPAGTGHTSPFGRTATVAPLGTV